MHLFCVVYVSQGFVMAVVYGMQYTLCSGDNEPRAEGVFLDVVLENTVIILLPELWSSFDPATLTSFITKPNQVSNFANYTNCNLH